MIIRSLPAIKQPPQQDDSFIVYRSIFQKVLTFYIKKKFSKNIRNNVEGEYWSVIYVGARCATLK